MLRRLFSPQYVEPQRIETHGCGQVNHREASPQYVEPQRIETFDAVERFVVRACSPQYAEPKQTKTTWRDADLCLFDWISRRFLYGSAGEADGTHS